MGSDLSHGKLNVLLSISIHKLHVIIVVRETTVWGEKSEDWKTSNDYIEWPQFSIVSIIKTRDTRHTLLLDQVDHPTLD